MNKSITLTEEQAKSVMQALDSAVRTGGLNSAVVLLPIATSIQSQLTPETIENNPNPR